MIPEPTLKCLLVFVSVLNTTNPGNIKDHVVVFSCWNSYISIVLFYFFYSSRSHLLLMLIVEGQDKVTGSVTKGTLTLCDLAGSERISKTEAEGQRLVEAAAINKSLSALGQVRPFL